MSDPNSTNKHPINDSAVKSSQVEDNVVATNTSESSNNKLSADEHIKEAIESEDNIQPTDVSLVCDEQSKTSKTPEKPVKPNKNSPLFLVIGLIGVFLMAIFYQTLFAHIERPAGDMVIEEGQSYYGFIPEFQRNVPIFSTTLAKVYIRTRGSKPLQAGTYEIPENPSFIELIAALQKGQKIDMVSVQIIEGKTAQDLYKVLANTDGITLEVLNEDGTPKTGLKQALGISVTTPDGEFTDNLEGWFAPDTYHYVKGTTDKQILIDLYQRQQKTLDEAWNNRAQNLPYQTPYEALIMASIIEKETSEPEERELVSSVFVNRLRKGMRLQTDPTIIYGMGEHYDGNIRRKDINEKTAYNTYQIDGLPPTPIALPSAASIKAALHPATSEALYFVATGNGGHKFTNTLSEHNKAVQEYLQKLREQKALEVEQAALKSGITVTDNEQDGNTGTTPAISQTTASDKMKTKQTTAESTEAQ